jgi:hypothetical protein
MKTETERKSPAGKREKGVAFVAALVRKLLEHSCFHRIIMNRRKVGAVIVGLESGN